MAEFAFLIKQGGENNIHTTEKAYAIVERDKLSARREGQLTGAQKHTGYRCVRKELLLSDQGHEGI